LRISIIGPDTVPTWSRAYFYLVPGSLGIDQGCCILPDKKEKEKGRPMAFVASFA
jgi:hypothetical protein